MADKHLQALFHLLDRETLALRGGDLGSLTSLAEEKTRLVAQLTETGGPDALLRLKEAAQRSHRQLAAALQGVQRAQSRMNQMRKMRGRLETYDRLGRRTAVYRGPDSLEHHA